MDGRFGAALVVGVGLVLASCGQGDQEQARERAAEARRRADEGAARAREEAHKLAHQAKEEARALNRDINDAVNGKEPAGRGTGETSQKVREAEVKLGQAAMIAKVKAKLANEVGLATVTSVDVDTSGQVVTLRGTVTSEEQRREAENAVLQVSGVSRVINDLEVRP
jgi:osmotically-inducible protein OsmY